MLFLRSLIFNIAFFTWTAICVTGFVPLSYISRAKMMAGIFWYMRSLRVIEKHIAGLDYRVEGLENLPDGPYIAAAKHQSIWETMMLSTIIKDPAIVLKRELLKIPLWGRLADKSDMIPVRRGGGQEAVDDMLSAARRLSGQGRPILIFPQGTRVAAGDWKRYKIGIGRLYEGLNLPLVPIAMNSGVFWGRHSFFKHPGVITVKILPAIPPGLPIDVLMQRLEYILETESEALSLAVGGPPTKRPADAPPLVMPEG